MKKIIHRLKRIRTLDIFLLFIAILLIFVFAFIFFRKATYITVTVKVGSDSVLWTGGSSHSWFTHYFREGMKQKDSLGKINAEVLNVRSYELSEQRSTSYLTVKLKAIYNRSSNQYTYLGKSVLIGSTIKLFLDQVLVEGLVTNIEGVKDNRQKKSIIIEAQVREENVVFPETSGIRPYIADAISAGEIMRDSHGQPVVTILEKRVQDAQKVVTASDGRVLLMSDPLKKDVFLKIQVDATKINNRYYVFDDVPVLIGFTIPFGTDSYSIYPEITKILTSP